MKQNLSEKSVQKIKAVSGHECGKNRPIRLKFWLNRPKKSRFWNFYRKQEPWSVGQHAKNIVWWNRDFFVTLWKNHAIERVKCAEWTTWKMTFLVKRAETNLDFQVSIARKTIKKKSERNQNLQCKRPESLCSACAPSMQFEAHVRKEITWEKTKFVSKRWI